jgi:ABC-2 type transport system ATP-binding protein
VIISCTDSDRAIRVLLAEHPLARDIEIAGGSLEEAFLELTGEPDVEAPGQEA